MLVEPPNETAEGFVCIFSIFSGQLKTSLYVPFNNNNNTLTAVISIALYHTVLYKINNNVYIKTSNIINYIIIILYSSHTHTHTHTHTHIYTQKECNKG